MILIRLLLTVAICLSALPSLLAQDLPIEEIVKRTIAKRENDQQVCAKYTSLTSANQLKYNKQMQPTDSTVVLKRSYYRGKEIAEVVLSITDNGVPIDSAKIERKVRELNEDWAEKQKDPEKAKKGSRDNFVDPFTAAGLKDYNFYLTGRGDSTFAVAEAVVSPEGTSLQAGAIDQSVAKLMSFYIVTVRSKVEEQRYLNATYWIDAQTFGVLRMVWTPSKLPSFVELLDFRMNNLVVMHNDVPIYLPRRFELKGKAGFLFMKGRFGVIEYYGDYRCDDTLDDSLFARRYRYKADGK